VSESVSPHHNWQSFSRLHPTGLGCEGGSGDDTGAVGHTSTTQPLARCGVRDRDGSIRMLDPTISLNGSGGEVD